MSTALLSDQGKLILQQIFKGRMDKLDLINRAIEFVVEAIPKNKLAQYVNEIRKLIENDKANLNIINLESTNKKFISNIEILEPIKKILENLYDFLEEIKYSKLNRSTRKFVEKNIDLISQIIILASIEGIEMKDLIDENVLIFILSFIDKISTKKLNMSVSNFMVCCGKMQTACIKF